MSNEIANQRSLLRLADITLEDLAANTRAIAAGNARPRRLDVVSWLLPPVAHALKGGVRTVFTFAQRYSIEFGTLNQFIIYSHAGRDLDTRGLCESLALNFPGLRFVVVVHRRGKDLPADLPPSNAAVCTLWTTAYLLAKYNATQAKYYLVQDFEPSFYSAGALYGAIEQTYRLGFSCIANTEGVASYCRRYTDDVIYFVPGVDRAVFKPDLLKRDPSEPRRIVLYGRPSNARNSFALICEITTRLKKRLGERVIIQSVGEAWDPDAYGLGGVVDNLGLLGSMDEVAALYRSSDLGVVFMMTPHPSYQPLEYMASGCVVATNINAANSWLIRDDNALVLEPVPAVAAERIHALLTDQGAWRSLRDAGLKTAAELSWDEAFKIVRERMLSY